MHGRGGKGRVRERHPFNILVQCRPAGDEFAHIHGVEMWTRDLHSGGLGLMWSLKQAAKNPLPAERDMQHPPETAVHAGGTGSGNASLWRRSPYYLLEESLARGIQISGLDGVPGWEGRGENRGRIIWFSSLDSGNTVHCGVQLEQTMPEVVLEKIAASRPETRSSPTRAGEDGGTAGQTENTVLIVSQDKEEAFSVLTLLGKLGLTGEISFSARDGLLTQFFHKNRAVVLDPVFNGKLNLHLLDCIRDNDPAVHLVLVFDAFYREEATLAATKVPGAAILLRPFTLQELKNSLPAAFPHPAVP